MAVRTARPQSAPRRTTSTKHRLGRAALAAAAAGTALVVTAAPSAAAPSCAGQTFSGVAKSGPGAVSDRVHVIKRVIIPEVAPGTPFGQVISRGLAQAPCD